MGKNRIDRIWYGGDYNPDQWPEDVWQEDVRLFRRAGIDIATLPVFSWAKLQPEENRFDFSWLDRVVALLHANGIAVCMATSTAAVPAWMAERYPDVLSTTIDGHRRKFGGRHNFCPHSPSYRRFAPALARGLAEHYGSHPAVAAWHVNNEYGGYCYCGACEAGFRRWLEARYGTLERLNEAWNAGFWGHTFSGWNQVVAPSMLSEHLSEERTMYQGMTLDYYRFMSESLLDCYRRERDAIKKVVPDALVTTNLMGTFKRLDYFRWAREMDVVSWDSYPSYDTPVAEVAMRHDLMRGLKGGMPFMLMEQTPSQQNWQPYNSLKRPGVMRLQSWQAIARGADAVMFFQLRRSRGGCEKFHGAVVEHAGRADARVFKEVAALGQELARLGDTLVDARVEARVGILFDWENWWAVDMSSGPSIALRYVDQVRAWHEALWAQNYPVALLGVEDDLDGFAVVIAPVLYMIKPGVAQRIASFVRRGGTFVTTFFSGIVNENDLVTLGGYPGELRELLGIWVEETDALPPGKKNTMALRGPLGALEGSFECGILCDLLHSEGAEVLADFGQDFYKGMPCLTRNRSGRGAAWYVASAPERRFLHGFLRFLAAESGIDPVLPVPAGVEVTRRRKGSSSFLIVLNHNDAAAEVDLGTRRCMDLLTGTERTGRFALASKDVAVLRE